MCWFLHWIALLFQFKAVCFGKCKSISSFFRKFEATTLSPVQGLGMYGFLKFSPLWLLYSDGWWMTVITCCSPFSRPVSILSDTITSQQVTYVHATEEPCWLFCLIANPDYCYLHFGVRPGSWESASQLFSADIRLPQTGVSSQSSHSSLTCP